LVVGVSKNTLGRIGKIPTKRWNKVLRHGSDFAHSEIL
jgi:hypothetical protein